MTNVARPEVSESANNDARTVLGAIRNTMDSLSPREKQIAKAIQASPEDILHMTVTDLATRANASESTTVRCCRRLGYNGYQDLKIHLARELSYATPVPKMSIPSQG